MLGKQANYLWRLVVTGFAFAALGIGGFVLATTVIPAANLLVRAARVRRRRSQRIIQASFRLYVWMLGRCGAIRLTVVGADRLVGCRGHLIIANHPTLLDVVLIMALVPNAQCVVKHQLWRNPLLRPVLRAAGYIRNDLAPEALVAACRETLAAGDNLIIFPEGTRSVPGVPLRFQRGFAHIATLAGADLQLVTITCEPIVLVKGQAWYEIPDRPSAFRIEVGKKVHIDTYLTSPSRAVAARRLLSHVKSHYDAKLNHR